MSCLFPVAQLHFYPRPPRGGRPPVSFFSAIFAYFYPRPPRGGRLSKLCSDKIQLRDFYPRPPRGGRPLTESFCQKEAQKFLSTPSARRATLAQINDINANIAFLSTPSARRATHGRLPATGKDSYFYPRPPRGGRPKLWMRRDEIRKISIHALREEGDAAAHCGFRLPGGFLSTPSARRATVTVPKQEQEYPISIHALREEGDWTAWSRAARRPLFLSTPSARRATRIAQRKDDLAGNFYPRPPRGGRPSRPPLFMPTAAFLSTPSARRATAPATIGASRNSNFYPRPPRGGRPKRSRLRAFSSDISIHALREEGDFGISCILHVFYDFYPRPPRGGRHRIRRWDSIRKTISIHALREEGD